MKRLLLFASVFFSCIVLKAQEPPPPNLLPGEHYTRLWSSSIDNQSIGSVKYLVENPSFPGQYCAIMLSEQDPVLAPGSRVIFSYSTDDGESWTSMMLDTSNLFSPNLTITGGVPVIACRKFPEGIVVYKELFFGAYGFFPMTGLPASVNFHGPQITGTSNGNLSMIALSGMDLHWTRTLGNNSWSPWVYLDVRSSSGSYCIQSNGEGLVSIFAIDNSENFSIKYFRSEDNGSSFDTGTTIFNYLIDGSDTLKAQSIGGMQAIYRNNIPHLVFTVYKAGTEIFPHPKTMRFIKPKILHWSPESGVSEVAGNYNMWNLADTITTSLMSPLCQPSIGIYQDGIICSFTAFLRGNVQTVDDGTVVNAGEIYLARSFNNGLTWSSFNVTYTPFVEEKNSFIKARNNNKFYNHLMYFRDLKAGSYIQHPEWGKAPVYGIFKKNNSPIGINENNSEPNTFILSQNYPNPFNPSTVIRYSLASRSGLFENRYATLKVYDVLGNEIATLVNEKQNEGSYSVEFDGSKYASGIYYYKLISGNFSDTKKMILLK